MDAPMLWICQRSVTFTLSRGMFAVGSVNSMESALHELEAIAQIAQLLIEHAEDTLAASTRDSQ
jgi:hypothetical protein